MTQSRETLAELTVAEALSAAANRLASAKIQDARREARLLVGTALGIDALAVLSHPERPLSDAERLAIDALVERRADREPAARLLGRREFWSRSFILSPDTLVPRPDSETLIEAVLGEIEDRAAPLKILDLGTGTGCLLVALLGELPQAWGLAVDRSAGAAMTAAENIRSAGLEGRAGVIVGNWAAALAGGFDIVVSNPPYIPSAEIDRLAPEVARHEPRLALDGGTDGLAAYRALADSLPRLLRAPHSFGDGGGVAILEMGAGQAMPVMDLMRSAGLITAGTRRDLAGIERCLMLRRA